MENHNVLIVIIPEITVQRWATGFVFVLTGG
jgi:hypothetical protein